MSSFFVFKLVFSVNTGQMLNGRLIFEFSIVCWRQNNPGIIERKLIFLNVSYFFYSTTFTFSITSSSAYISTRLGNGEKIQFLQTRPERSPTGTNYKNIVLSSLNQKLFFFTFFSFSMHQIGQNRLKMSGIFRGS